MSDNSQSKIVVVGAGMGGGNLVANLRQAGHKGEIELIGEEPVVPYHRPPLSKAYLQGKAAAEALKLRLESYYDTNNITLRLGRKVVGIDPNAKTVALDDATSSGFDILVLATGSRARRLAIPGAGLGGIFYLRDMKDADLLRDTVGPGRRLAIVGGGYVGLEVAASALDLGAEVVLIEREARLLARVACEPLASFFDSYHRSKGLKIVTSAQAEAFLGGDGQITAVKLMDGGEIACDAAVVGVGGEVCDELAREAGLKCQNGVVVDEDGRTSVPGIYAIGDMTLRPMPLYQNRMFRLESVPNAVEQARRVAADVMGKPKPAHEVPWFWSDQYDLKLQIVGIPFDAHRLVVRGSIESGAFAIFHLAEDGGLLAIEAVNSPKEFMAGRTLVGERRIVPEDKLADMAVTMKDIMNS